MATEQEYGSLVQETMRAVETVIPGLRFETFGGMVPLQGTGIYQGEPFYFRFRHDSASFEVYDEGVDPFDYESPSKPNKVARIEGVTGEQYAGYCLPVPEMTTLFGTLVGGLEPYDQEVNPSGVDILRAQVDDLLLGMGANPLGENNKDTNE